MKAINDNNMKDTWISGRVSKWVSLERFYSSDDIGRILSKLPIFMILQPLDTAVVIAYKLFVLRPLVVVN